MKNYTSFSFLFFFLFSIACSSNTETKTLNNADGKVSITQFKTKLAATSAPQLIDVRTPNEFNQGSLDGALNMDFRSQNLENQLNTLDKTKPVFIFCQAGGRSGKCYKKMKDMGFSEVYDMEGGYGAWSKQ